MEAILAVSAIGILATAAMTSFLWLLTRLDVAHVDMVRAIGSLITRTYERSLLPGLIVHFGIGLGIAHLYAMILEIPRLESIVGYATVGGFLGLLHGTAVSIGLVILIAEHHPLERFQKAGILVAILHIFAHVVYGVTVGALWGAWILSHVPT